MKKLPKINPDNQGMKNIAGLLKELLPEKYGFALLVFEYNNVGMSNYVSSANRSDMVKALREAANRLEGKKDFMTPNDN